MQSWGRVGSKILEFSRQGTRIGGGVSWKGPLFVGRRSISCGRRTHNVVNRWRTEQLIPSRRFAAPVQTKPKPEAKETQGTRLNREITAPFVRLVSDEGHAIVSRQEALDRAVKLKLDLVEVQRNANPPVCKIMDYHREKYKQQLKEKDRMKSKSEVLRKGDCKEVRFTMKTEQKDLQIKANTIKRLMERGYRVKCMAMGNEGQDLGTLLSRLAVLIEDVSFVESGPKVEKRQAFMVVRHAKFGPPKSKSAPKAAKMMSASESPSTVNASISSRNPEVEVQLESEYKSEPESLSLADEGEEFSANTEMPSSEVVDAVPWSDFNLQDDSETSFNLDTIGTKTDPYKEGNSVSVPQMDLYGMTDDSVAGPVDGNLVDIVSSMSKTQNKDPGKVFPGVDMYTASGNHKPLSGERGTREPSLGTPFSDHPLFESLGNLIEESKEAKDSMRRNPTFSRLPFRPEAQPLNDNLSNRTNDFNVRSSEVKRMEFNHLGPSDSPHSRPTFTRPILGPPDINMPAGTLRTNTIPMRENGRSIPAEMKQGEAKDFRGRNATFSRMSLHPENQPFSDNVSTRANDFNGRPPQVKPADFNRFRSTDSQHIAPTFRRPAHVAPDMNRPAGEFLNAAPQTEGGRRDPPETKQGEALGSSAPKTGYGIFSSAARQESTEKPSSEGSAGKPDPNDTGMNRYKSRPEAQRSVHGGNPGKTGGGWGVFSRDPTNQQRRNADS